VIVWANGQMECCWVSGGEFFLYDGTWMMAEKNRIGDATHWINIDWMISKSWPEHGPGIVNKARHHWRKLTNKAQDMAYDLRPKGWSKTAQLTKKVTFYRDASGRIMTGMPENIPTPRGLERIVCGTVQDAERYSALQRRQEGYEHRRQLEERGAIEGQFRDEIRSEMRTKMANARNNTNREFMRRALERMDSHGDPTAYERESYLHSEAYEKNH